MSTTKNNAIPKYSPYTAALKKEIRKTTQLICYVSNEDCPRNIYIMTDHVLVRMDKNEYNAFIRPATECGEGNYHIMFTQVVPYERNLEKKLSDEAAGAVFDLERTPMEFRYSDRRPKTILATYYNENADFVTMIDTDYDSIIDSNFTRRNGGAESLVVVFDRGTPMALLGPVRIDDKYNIQSAVRAWFTGKAPTPAEVEPAEEAEPAEAEIYKQILDLVNHRILDLESERDALQAKYADLQSRYEELTRGE